MFRERIISLTGFMGSGKSSVGRELSALLSCPLVDLDSYIEEKEGRTIPEIFASDGEAAFRAMELSALQSLLCPGEEELRCGHWDTGRQRQISHSVCGFLQADNGIKNPPYMILALGGGTLTTAQCADLIRRHTYCIYLRAGIDTLVRNLRNDTAGRPLLSPAAKTSPTYPGTCNCNSDSAMSKTDSGNYPETIRKPDGNLHSRQSANTANDCHSERSEESANFSHTKNPDAEESALRSRIEALMSDRNHIYESAAGLIIDIDGKTFPAIASEIAGRLQQLH